MRAPRNDGPTLVAGALAFAATLGVAWSALADEGEFLRTCSISGHCPGAQVTCEFKEEFACCCVVSGSWTCTCKTSYECQSMTGSPDFCAENPIGG